MVLTTDIEKGNQSLFYLMQFVLIFLIGIFQLFESACRIYVVAWIDAHLLGIECSHFCHLGIEVHICHKRHLTPFLSQCLTDMLQVFCLSHSLSGKTHIFSAGIHYAQRLRHTALCIGSGSGGH